MKRFYFIGLVAIFFIESCAKEGVLNVSDKTPLSIDAIAFQIVEKISQKIGDDAKVAVAPFEDEKLGGTQGNAELVNKIIETSKKFIKMNVSIISSKNLKDKEYVMSGITGNDAKEGFFYVHADVKDNKTGDTIIVFNYITEKLEQKQTKFYRESPIELHPKTESENAIALSEKIKTVENEKNNKVTALLNDAITAYEQDNNYSEALKMFEQAAASEKGKNQLRSYSGIYQSSIKLKLFEKARETFAKIIAIAMPQGEFTAKFLFEKDSEDELYPEENRSDYLIWIEQLGIYFKKNQQCVDIIGHSSRTGSAEYNEKLSEKRAKTIQQWIELQGRSRTVGKGFSESRSLDGEENEFDRRVEFKPIDCSTVK